MRKKSHPFFFLISPSVVAGIMGAASNTNNSVLDNNTDLNTINSPGVFAGKGDCTYPNAPVNSVYFIMTVYSYDANWSAKLQILTTQYGGIFIRSSWGGNWNLWKEL